MQQAASANSNKPIGAKLFTVWRVFQIGTTWNGPEVLGPTL